MVSIAAKEEQVGEERGKSGRQEGQRHNGEKKVKKRGQRLGVCDLYSTHTAAGRLESRCVDVHRGIVGV